MIPVNYKLHEGSIVFRTVQDSPTDEDLRTGIKGAEYKVAFEIDDVDRAAREGWSVLIQGSAHHVDSETERVSVLKRASSRGPAMPGNPSFALSPPVSPAGASAGSEKKVQALPTCTTGRLPPRED